MIEKPIPLYCGYEEREAVGFHTFVSSVIRRSSRAVQITPLSDLGMATGSNAFSCSRFLVPYLNGFKGYAIFADASDMLCLDDVAKLARLFNPSYAVQVVMHPDYDSKHSRKYIGTPMECEQSNYSRKNWASLMLFNCEHKAWAGFTPQGIAKHTKLELLQFQHLLDKEIGSLPPEWNVLIDEGQDDKDARVIHYTNGIPAFPHYANSRRSKDWFVELAELKGE